MNHWRRHTAPHSVWAGKTTRERLAVFLHRHAYSLHRAIHRNPYLFGAAFALALSQIASFLGN